MDNGTQILANGKIVRKGWEFIYGFGVVTAANKAEFTLERDSPINGETVTGIMVRKKSTNSKSLSGAELVNDSVFLSSHLVLKQRNAEILDTVALDLIYQFTSNGRWFPCNLPAVDMAQSTVKCSNSAALVADEEYEFVFRYIRTITQEK